MINSMKKTLLLLGVLIILSLNTNTTYAQLCDVDADGFIKDNPPACICNPGVDCDCDDGDPGVGLLLDCYPDCDGDGWGDSAAAPDTQCVGACNALATKCNGFDYVNNNLDCNDGDEDVWELKNCYPDCDNDGQGRQAAAPTVACVAACSDLGATCSGFLCNCIADNRDCEDGYENTFQGASEKCDGLDNNCPPDGIIDNGCDDDNDGYCDSFLGYAKDLTRVPPLIIVPGPTPAVSCMCPIVGGSPVCDCDDTEADDVMPGSDCQVGPDPGESQCAENIHPGAVEVCDWVDNDCNGDIDDVCPMVPPEIEIFDSNGVQVVGPPPEEMIPCSSSGSTTTCYYFVTTNPGAFKEQGDFTVNMTWAMPVGDRVDTVMTVNHDATQEACECFYATACKGITCWNWPGEWGVSGMECCCCGDDGNESLVGGTDSVPGHLQFACCDNKDGAGADLPADECVIDGICKDYSPEVPTETAGMCDGKDNDCDGYTDEECACDSAKLTCDTNTSCPNFLCNSTWGLPASCWSVGGDAPTGASMCCGDSDDAGVEFYIWNSCDGSDACCDNKDENGNPIGTECVLRGVCRDRPAVAETCNFVDDDCDCLVDEDFDGDHDGVATCAGDCNDTNPGIYPGAPEICNDNTDQNCDGEDTKCAEPEEAALFNLCRLIYDTLYLLIYIAIAVTVLLLVIGGLTLIGADDLESAANAKNMIKNTIIGLIIVVALLGIAHMFVPDCAPLPGEGYDPPARYTDYPPLVVTITRPLDEEFFEEGETADFDERIIGGVEPYVYVWDVGDGTPTVTGTCNSTMPTWPICPGPAHNYSFTGNYTAKVVITDSIGERAVDMVNVLVGIIVARIDAPRNEFAEHVGNSIQFNGSVHGGASPYSYEWTSDKDSPPALRSTGFVAAEEDKFSTPPNTLSVDEHVITLTITDVKGRTASTSIELDVLTDVPSIANAQSCWKHTGGEDETFFEFEVAPAIPLNDMTVSVAVVETGSCVLEACCVWDWDFGDYRSVVYPGLTAPFPPNTWYFDDFCKKARKLQIEVSGEDAGTMRRWKFCAICDAENPSRYCPGDPYPEEWHPCSVELGACVVSS